MLCVFDIESVPDVKLLRAVYGYEGPSVEVAKMAIEEHGFLPVTFHQVVAISAVIADEFGRFIRVNSIEGESEEALVGSFLKFIDKHNPKLVSFNGRGFDMPLLINRALKYNFTCSAYFETENRALNKNKWDNYRYRYSDNFHIDLLDHIGDFGAVRGLKLDHICQSVGLPGKFDVHGDDVLELYFASEQKKILEYC